MDIIYDYSVDFTTLSSILAEEGSNWLVLPCALHIGPASSVEILSDYSAVVVLAMFFFSRSASGQVACSVVSVFTIHVLLLGTDGSLGHVISTAISSSVFNYLHCNIS